MFPGGWGSQISRQSVYAGGTAVSYAPAIFTSQEIIVIVISVRNRVRPQGHSEAERIMKMQ